MQRTGMLLAYAVIGSWLLAGCDGFYGDMHLEDFVKYHNSLPDVTWKATTDNFRNVAVEDRLDFYRTLAGVRTPPPMAASKIDKKRKTDVISGLPEEFDARDKWPYCPSIGEIRDQGACGSCYAVATVSTATDRLCIASKGETQAHLSEEDVISCCDKCGSGCHGGFVDFVWDYIESDGVVTGGQWNTSQGCYPYEIRPCNSNVSNVLGPCNGTHEEAPACKSTCRSDYHVPYKNDKHRAEETYQIDSKEDAIRTEIYLHGPVVSSIQLHDDFGTYKSGVFVAYNETYDGRHAIKIIGWGKEKGVPYWTCVNSWHAEWGDGGYFKIRRGTNECDVEGEVFAGIMKAK